MNCEKGEKWSCPEYCGIACTDGRCSFTLHPQDLSESDCADCQFYKFCDNCIFRDSCEELEAVATR